MTVDIMYDEGNLSRREGWPTRLTRMCPHAPPYIYIYIYIYISIYIYIYVSPLYTNTSALRAPLHPYDTRVHSPTHVRRSFILTSSKNTITAGTEL